MKTILARLLHDRFNAVAQDPRRHGLVELYIIQRYIAESTFTPITTVRHGELIPAAIAPHPVHGVHHFYGRNILIKFKVCIIRCADFTLPVIFYIFIIDENHDAFFQ